MWIDCLLIVSRSADFSAMEKGYASHQRFDACHPDGMSPSTDIIYGMSNQARSTKPDHSSQIIQTISFK